MPVPATRSRSTGPTADALDAEADQPAEPEPLPAKPHCGDGDDAGAAPIDAGVSGTLAPRTALTPEPTAVGLGAPPPVDPLVDSGSVGLRMFNLGTIPASVTPPRSWRRAAWFAIASSVAALVGLLAVGALLVGPSQHHSRITALPYFPDGSPLRTIDDPTDEPTTLGHHTDRTTVRPDTRAAVQPASTPAADTGPATAVGIPAASGTGDADPTGATTDQPANPPVRLPPETDDTITVNGSATGDPVVDPAKMVKRTHTFFAEVTSNAQAAANLTAGALHDDAVALIRQRYGDVSSIRIQRISLDPSNGVTVCLLRLVNRDGTTQTQQTTLHFTLSSDPKITNPGG